MNPKAPEGWGTCPVCGSDQIAGDFVAIDGPWARQDVDCLACGARWVDEYHAYNRASIEPAVGTHRQWRDL